MKNYLMNFDEITDVYSGFLLKEDFLTAGTEALKDCGDDIIFAPEWKDGMICFTVASYPYFDDDNMLDIAWGIGFDVETPEEARAAVPEEGAWVVAVNVTISVKEQDGKRYVGGVRGEYVGLDHERKPLDEDYDDYADDVDDDSVFAVIEAFLDNAVDAR